MPDQLLILAVITAIVIVMAAMTAIYGFWEEIKTILYKLFHKTPMWVWIVLGVTIYFTLGHIYASWLIYAHAHPGSWAEAILGPWPLGLPVNPTHDFNWVVTCIAGPIGFLIWWAISVVAHAGWIIFGGGLAELFHRFVLPPR
jgi:hypothetical protein